VEQIAKIYEDAVAKGIQPKAIVLINPGNPTGNVFDKDKMEAILEFSSRKGLLILADEVYQENIYSSKPWYSFRKVLKEAPSEISKSVELVSFHSLSKGVLSECGLRGGYMHFTNISPDFVKHFKKYYSNVWPNNIGQAMLLMKVMFLSGEFQEIASPKCFEMLKNEYKTLFESLKYRAQIATKLLNQTNNMRCNEIEGAMYAFPQIMLPPKMIQKASELQVVPDVLYCKLMLEMSGICLVPGSGFGQQEGTFHFRTTILPSPDNYFEEIFSNLKKTHESIIEKFA
jgi:aspartate/methionine/tyrosine aminotransferase